MTEKRMGCILLFLAVLMMFSGSPSCTAEDMNSILNGHDPTADSGGVLLDVGTASPTTTATETPPTTVGSATATAKVEELLKKLEQLVELINKLLQIQNVKIAGNDDKAQTGKESGGTQGGSTYTVQSGDCLWTIAERFLGDGSRYMEIVEANKEKYPSLLKNPNLIYPGWELTIPGGTGTNTGNTNPGNNTGTTPPNTNVPTPPAGAKGGPALYAWLQQAGLSGEKLRTAWAVGMAESGGNPRAHNGNAGTGDNSYGLYQINMLGAMGPERRRQYGLSSNEDLFDPMTNIKVMLKMSNNCTNWQPWSAYKNGSYKKFLNNYPPK